MDPNKANVSGAEREVHRLGLSLYFPAFDTAMKGFVEFWGNAVYRHTVSWRVPRSAPGQLGSSERGALPAADHRGDTQRGSSPAAPGLPVLARLRAPHRLVGAGAAAAVFSQSPHIFMS